MNNSDRPIREEEVRRTEQLHERMTQTSQDDSLCDYCQILLLKISTYPTWPSTNVTRTLSRQISFPLTRDTQPADKPAILVDFHNIQSLISSALDGCHLCTLIMAQLDLETVTELLDELSQSPEIAWDQLRFLVWRSGTQLVVRLQEPVPADGFVNERWFLHLRHMETNRRSLQRTTFETSSNSTASFETFSKIHHWLWRCENNHEKCIRLRANQQMQPPTRLIHVGRFASTSIVRLVEAGDLPSNMAERRYITLSHCWGTGEVTGSKLTSAGYDEFCHGLELQRLPKTFRDAITLTRYLGMQYIWIDCMCIVQDSDSDWKRESYRMSQIYSGSFLNVGANAYCDSNGGLFHDRNPYAIMPLGKILQWPPGRQTIRKVAFFPITDFIDSVRHAPLSKRGWVTQERLLAPRTLHFTSLKAIWECPTLIASETDVTGELEIPEDVALGYWPLIPASLEDPTTRAITCLEKWCRAISQYTSGDLTFQSDKLMAIVGLADRLKSSWNDDSVRYLAGLWSYKLETSLLWTVSSDSEALDRLADVRAPTWSWATIRGSIHLRYPDSMHDPPELLSTVTEVETSPIGHLLGPVSGGFMRIRGPVCLVTATEDTEGSLNTLQLDGVSLCFRELSFDRGKLIPVNETHSQELYLLGIVRTVSDEIRLEGLVLRASCETHGEYTRVGNWATSHQNKERESSWRMWEILGADLSGETGRDFALISDAFTSMNLKPEAFEEADFDSNVYTIKIV